MRKSIAAATTLLSVFGALALVSISDAQTSVKTPSVIPPVTPPPRTGGGKGVYLAGYDRRLVSSNSDTEVVRLSIPSGMYWVTAKGVIANETKEALSVSCALHDGGGTSPTSALDYVSITVAPQQRSALTLMGRYVNKSRRHEIALSCRGSTGSRPMARWFKLSALSVDSITGR